MIIHVFKGILVKIRSKGGKRLKIKYVRAPIRLRGARGNASRDADLRTSG